MVIGMKYKFYRLLAMQILGLFAIILVSPIREFYGVLAASLMALAVVLGWMTVCFVMWRILSNAGLWVMSVVYDGTVIVSLGLFTAYAGGFC